MISVERASYWYPGAADPALREVSLEIGAGEFVLVCGPSGSGKSTLLRAFNGLVPHFHGGSWSGRVLVAGHDTRQIQPRDLAEHVGFVFQDPDAQFVVDLVEDELAFAMENAGLPPRLMRRRVEEALDQVEIAHLRHRMIPTLSGGERQRVAIAAALTVQPAILLLDEPTSQLDPHTAEEVLTTLHKLNADLGLTIILSEHRLERVVQYADRVLWVRPPADPAAPTPISFGPPREVLAAMDNPPPLAAAARIFGWQPLPLTIKEGRKLRESYQLGALWAPIGYQERPRETAAEQGQAGPIQLQAQRLKASYDGIPALHNVDFALRAGEIAAVMGRNGSGKTTLLRHLVGLQRPAGGKVLLRGADIGGRPVESLAREIGYVPQNPNDLLYHDTLAEELRFTLRSHGLPASEERVAATLAALGIAHLAGQYPRDLSGGEAQRAALAAILVAEPPILLLDEPTRGLDYAAKAGLALLLKAQAAAGRAVALVSHDVEFVALCADSMLLLGEGEVVVGGPAGEVLGGSLLFSTQVGKLFPGAGWLTVADIERALAAQ